VSPTFSDITKKYHVYYYYYALRTPLPCFRIIIMIDEKYLSPFNEEGPLSKICVRVNARVTWHLKTRESKEAS